jgi:hypothetical protein
MTVIIRNPWPGRPIAGPVRSLAAVALSLILAGCALPPMEAGKMPKTEALSSLVTGRSTPEQVRALLGEPQGGGAARYRPDLPRHTVWYYELVQMKGDQVGINILLVLFDGGRYDGYLWFRGRELLKGLTA